MYTTRKEIAKYLDYFVSPNEKEQFLKAKKIIENEYFPTKGWAKQRLTVAKKAISEFCLLKPKPELEAELMIFLVECGCRYTNDYGDMSSSFYTGIENNYIRALKFMKKHGLLERFRPNVERCVKWSSDCGYGFADSIGFVFDEYYSESE